MAEQMRANYARGVERGVSARRLPGQRGGPARRDLRSVPRLADRRAARECESERERERERERESSAVIEAGDT